MGRQTVDEDEFCVVESSERSFALHYAHNDFSHSLFCQIDNDLTFFDYSRLVFHIRSLFAPILFFMNSSSWSD